MTYEKLITSKDYHFVPDPVAELWIPGPCDDCPLYHKCANEKLACAEYHRWCESEQKSPEWDDAKRGNPVGIVYHKHFPNDGKPKGKGIQGILMEILISLDDGNGVTPTQAYHQSRRLHLDLTYQQVGGNLLRMAKFGKITKCGLRSEAVYYPATTPQNTPQSL